MEIFLKSTDMKRQKPVQDLSVCWSLLWNLSDPQGMLHAYSSINSSKGLQSFMMRSPTCLQCCEHATLFFFFFVGINLTAHLSNCSPAPLLCCNPLRHSEGLFPVLAAGVLPCKWAAVCVSLRSTHLLSCLHIHLQICLHLIFLGGLEFSGGGLCWNPDNLRQSSGDVGVVLVGDSKHGRIQAVGRAAERSLFSLPATANFNWKHRLEMGVNLLVMWTEVVIETMDRYRRDWKLCVELAIIIDFDHPVKHL